MMTFYAAAGSYQIRSEDGKNMTEILSIGFTGGSCNGS